MFGKKDYERDKAEFIKHKSVNKPANECRTCGGRNDNHASGMRAVRENGRTKYVHTPCPESRNRW